VRVPEGGIGTRYAPMTDWLDECNDLSDCDGALLGDGPIGKARSRS
jgi:hypothetical protein